MKSPVAITRPQDAADFARVDVWTVAGDNLGAGDYYLRVNGTIVSDDGASFGGAMMLMPVPEPGAYGMMLGGLGILGFLARRRQAKRE